MTQEARLPGPAIDVTARIPFPNLDHLDEAQRAAAERIVAGRRGHIVGPLLMALHRPDLAEHWSEMGAILRYETSLAPRLSELAILATARHMTCQYEWLMHEPPAREGGLADAVIEAIRAGNRPDFADEDEATVYDYCVELHRTHRVTQAAYDKALALLGVVGIIELTTLVGYYTLVAMNLNAHDFTLPADVPNPLPPLD